MESDKFKAIMKRRRQKFRVVKKKKKTLYKWCVEPKPITKDHEGNYKEWLKITTLCNDQSPDMVMFEAAIGCYLWDFGKRTGLKDMFEDFSREISKISIKLSDGKLTQHEMGAFRNLVDDYRMEWGC